VKIEAEDVETVGGLLAQRLGRVPIAGSTATVAGLRLTAESLAGRRNRIAAVTVQRVGKGAGQDGSPSDEADGGSAGGAGGGRGDGTDGRPGGASPGGSGRDPSDEDTDQWAWAADDIPGQPAAELAEKATELDDGRH
jgi:hypothetical protein